MSQLLLVSFSLGGTDYGVAAKRKADGALGAGSNVEVAAKRTATDGGPASKQQAAAATTPATTKQQAAATTTPSPVITPGKFSLLCIQVKEKSVHAGWQNFARVLLYMRNRK